MNVELLGINHLRTVVSSTDYLIIRANENDKEPSWDGHIEVYSKPGDTHNKADLIKNVPIQVKGHKSNDLAKETISYPVEISDLRNYLNAGGTAFIVVYVDETGLKYSIYMNRLLPFELKQILGEKKSGTKSIHLTRFPVDKVDLANIFIGFARDMLQQSAAINAEPITLDEFMSQYPGNELSVSFTQIADKKPDTDIPFAYMFDHDTYLYGSIGHGIKLPLQHILRIETAGTVIYKPVCIDGKKYYSQYQEIYTKLYKEFVIGKSIRYKITYLIGKPEFTIRLSGNIDDRILDSDFIIDAYAHHSFSIGDVTVGFAECEYQDKNTLNSIKRLKELRDYYKDIKKVLHLLNVKTELNLESMKEADWINMGRLIDAFLNKKAVPVAVPDSMIGTFTVGNLNLLVWAVKADENGLCYLFNFTDNPYELKCLDDEGKEFDSNVMVTLDTESILKFCNLDYKKIVKQLDNVTLSEMYNEQLNGLLLRILSAYDKRKDKSILSFAEGVLNVMRKGSLKDSPIFILNELQTIYRKRNLKSREITKLKNLINTYKESYDIMAGAYILLRNKLLANEIIERMESEKATAFKEMPIYTLLNV